MSGTTYHVTLLPIPTTSPSFTSPLAGVLSNYIEGWKIELLDVDDVIKCITQAGPIPNAYVKNADTLVQLGIFRSNVVSSINSCQSAINGQSYPANPIFDKTVGWTPPECVATRQGKRWFQKAHGMEYTQMHATHFKGVGGGGSLPPITVTLTGSILDQVIQAFDSYISPWFDAWWAATGLNETGFPLLGDTSGTQAPHRPIAGPILQLQHGVSALQGDTNDIVGIVGQYGNSNTIAEINKIKNTYLPNVGKALNQAIADEALIFSGLQGDLNYDVNGQSYNTALCVDARITYRWLERAKNNTVTVTHMVNLPSAPNSVFQIDGGAELGKWPSIMDHIYSLDQHVSTTNTSPPGPIAILDGFLNSKGCSSVI